MNLVDRVRAVAGTTELLAELSSSGVSDLLELLATKLRGIAVDLEKQCVPLECPELKQLEQLVLKGEVTIFPPSADAHQRFGIRAGGFIHKHDELYEAIAYAYNTINQPGKIE